jgi:outer membrane receptor protein involved in Fe transport
MSFMSLKMLMETRKRFCAVVMRMLAAFWIASNIQHSISASYQATRDLAVRAGITNITDKMPSYPTLSYGDILGRRYFLGVNLHL